MSYWTKFPDCSLYDYSSSLQRKYTFHFTRIKLYATELVLENKLF